mgnify:CR=1 FL=1
MEEDENIITVNKPKRKPKKSSSSNSKSNSENMPAIQQKAVIPDKICLVPLLHKPMFPNMIAPLIIEGRPFHELLTQTSKKNPPLIGAVLVKDNFNPDNMTADSFYQVGVIGRIIKIFQQNETHMQVLLDIICRMEITEFLALSPFPVVSINIIDDSPVKKTNKMSVKALSREIINNIKELIHLNPLVREELNHFVNQISIEDPSRLADFAATLTTAEKEKLQDILETLNIQNRLEKTLFLVKKELDLSHLQAKISKQIEDRMSKNQRDFFLREQLKEIKKELGISKDDKTQEIDKLIEKASKLKMSDEAKKVFEEELHKLSLLELQSPEFNVSRNYLDWFINLPWGIYSKDNFDINKAKKILNRDHYGLDDLEDKILRIIATLSLKKEVSGTILCLVGPPGVGKTSVGKSIASALNRKFYRFSLGGMRDEAEIKGHRRTYIGAMPGKFIQALKVVKKSNPVIMLDEIDKIGNSFHGDPASALLEALDPEQNTSFLDHYMDVPFDLSKVFFIATANQLDTIPSALLDRMEILRLAGYIAEEKLNIAKKYIIPKQRKNAGLTSDNIRFTDNAILNIINGYARESGVRRMEQNIQNICRGVALNIVRNDPPQKRHIIDEKAVLKYLKSPHFTDDDMFGEGTPGCVNGLAWTSLGGSTLMIESVSIEAEKPGFKQSGQLGKVMVESSEIAYSFIKANCKKFGGDPAFFDKSFIHLHVPAGAVPKDGPSAGITMALSFLSLMLNKPVIPLIGMTGELTLTGQVLPIGGLKEKTIAAIRGKLTQIICPAQNEKDYIELPDHLKTDIKFHFVKSFDEVVKIALESGKKKK